MSYNITPPQKMLCFLEPFLKVLTAGIVKDEWISDPDCRCPPGWFTVIRTFDPNWVYLSCQDILIHERAKERPVHFPGNTFYKIIKKKSINKKKNPHKSKSVCFVIVLIKIWWQPFVKGVIGNMQADVWKSHFIQTVVTTHRWLHLFSRSKKKCDLVISWRR